MSLLEVRNLRVSFATPRGAVQAVENFGVSVDEGETVALVGESGSGKSVSALALARLLPTPPAPLDMAALIATIREVVQPTKVAYRVLLTRGMRGTRLFVLDEETREHVAERLVLQVGRRVG